MSSELPSLPSVDAARPVDSTPPSPWRRPSAVIAAVAVALLGWQWLETRSRLADLQDELARRLTDSDTAAKEGRALAKQAQEGVQDLQSKLGALEGRIAESQGQQVALEAMYQEFSRTRDDRVLTEVEQAVTIAAQQLQLAGNVQAALFALQTADARLGSVDRPHWLPLRKALAADMDSLKALPQIDAPGIALRLETLVGRIDGLPLAFEAHPRAEAAKADKTEASWAARMWSEFWNDFSQLVRIERLDRPDPALLAPSNAVFLRENLKLRLLNARLALLSRQFDTAQSDLRDAQEMLNRYFDTRSRKVSAVTELLRQVSGQARQVSVPRPDDTLAALTAAAAGR
mgnify:CR=1 FL=1